MNSGRAQALPVSVQQLDCSGDQLGEQISVDIAAGKYDDDVLAPGIDAAGQQRGEANGAAPGSGEKLPSVHGPLLHSETITTLPGKRLELASCVRIGDASPNHCHTPEPPVAFTHG